MKSFAHKWVVLLAILLAILLATVVPVSAAVGMQINLGKTYTFKNVSISSINAIDLSDPSVSQVNIASTVGDNSDLQTIHGPQISQVTRDFVTTTGTFDGLTVNITGSTSPPVSWLTKPDYQIYIQRVVPTLDITVPGMTGNPIITKYNQSWNKGDLTSMSSLFQSSGGIYLYKVGNALNINPATNIYTASYTTPAWLGSQNDFGYVLNANAVSLASFFGDSDASLDMGTYFPTTLPTPGKYYASAVSYDGAAHALNLYALSPVVILNGTTPIQWTNSSSFTGTNFGYIKGSGQDITLGFTGTNPDLGTIKNVTYLFINDTAQYNLDVTIDTQKLAQNAQNDWQSSLPGTEVIDLLNNGIQQNIGTPFNYTLTAVGEPTPSSSTNWSYIAVTPGYGISGNTTSGSSITIPNATMDHLNPGRYDLYLMGTNQNNDIVALDQEQVNVGSGAQPPVANFSASPTSSGYNMTVHFTDTSTGSPTMWNWSFGDGTFSTLQNPVHIYTQTDDTRRSYDVSLNVTNAAGQFNTSLQTGYIHVMSFSEYYRSVSSPVGNISTSTFVQAIDDWRLQRPVATFTVSPSTSVFVGLIEDWRLQRPLA